MDMFTQVHLTYLKVTIVCGVLLFEIFMDWYENFEHANKHFTTQQKRDSYLLWLSQLLLNDIKTTPTLCFYVCVFL